MIKYSNRGLVQNETNKISLFDLLYITSFMSWFSAGFLTALFKANLDETFQEVQSDKVRVKTGIGFVFLLTFLLMFLNVQYIKKKRPILPKIQNNIVTFAQSFYLYIIFFLVNLLVTTLKENKKEAAAYLFVSKLLFFHFIVPCMIIYPLCVK